MGLERVKNQTLNISKVANYISHQAGLVNELGTKVHGAHEIDIGISNETTLITLLEKEEIKLSKDVSLEDMAVMDVIASLYVSGIKNPSLDSIARLLSSDRTKRPSQEKLQRISESIKKMSRISIEINITEEVKEGGKKINKPKAFYEGTLLHIDAIEISSNGIIIQKKYNILAEPILYTYASALGHIVTVPTALLETTNDVVPKNIRNTDEFVLFKRAIIKRIKEIKNPKNNFNNTRIVYERYEGRKLKGFFQEMGYESSQYKNWPVKKSKLHRIIIGILDDLVAKEEIRGYTVLKEGKSYYGVDLDMEVPKKKRKPHK